MSVSRTLLAVSACLLVFAPAGADADDRAAERVKANFVAADINKDDGLDGAEFRTFIDLNAQFRIGQAGMVKRMNRYGTAFARLDTNADGLVTREELVDAAQ